ncbi:hypothetical protein BN2475_380022 [Paraburkholderia ribeironis]|uniref:Uncharacterized protein n=1 Tax=Paraburkholderia ribeironis TaxID=1247936 RepID=A0A1N7S5P5_9BURK|nr:hypothetical protein BN2475_380022 [Paraburkholderia ribeironis]
MSRLCTVTTHRPVAYDLTGWNVTYKILYTKGGYATGKRNPLVRFQLSRFARLSRRTAS